MAFSPSTRHEAQERNCRQQIMALMTIPTQTAGPDRGRSEASPKRPVITPQARALPTSPFVLGPDTCGFAAQSTSRSCLQIASKGKKRKASQIDGSIHNLVTCGTGQECKNVGNYRGCCEVGADCSETIYTECRSYEDSEDPAQCGPNTLCW